MFNIVISALYCSSAHLQFLLGFIKPLGISRVYHVYQDVGVVEVIPPVRSDLSLTSDVPDIELEAFALNRFDVKTLKIFVKYQFK